MDKAFQLYESIQTTNEIQCDYCYITSNVTGCDDTEACDVFYSEGWRARKKTYCPKCAKKKLKNLN